MSAKALFDEELAIVETPMPYHERVGASKLRVLSDGVRFLRSIVESALIYRPGRLFSLLALHSSSSRYCFTVHPVEVYISERRLEEWMIYRLITVLCATSWPGCCSAPASCPSASSPRTAGRRRVTGFMFD